MDLALTTELSSADGLLLRRPRPARQLLAKLGRKMESMYRPGSWHGHAVEANVGCTPASIFFFFAILASICIAF